MIYRGQFFVILPIVLLVWIPANLIASYCETFIFAEDDIARSIRLGRTLDHLLGIIAIAGVTYTAMEDGAAGQAGVGPALSAGFRNWGRMWWTRFLWTIALVLGFLLLIVPGVIMLIRFSLAETLVVTEGVWGIEALTRSWELTRGRFWQITRLLLMMLVVLTPPVVAVISPAIFIPGLDHWVIGAGLEVCADVIGAFGTVLLFTAYQQIALEPVKAQRTV